MTLCSRKWQVEATHDGRLTGKDLASAIRHRDTCAECAQEARALLALGQQLAQLGELERDALTARRTRQKLTAALNEAVLSAPRPKHAVRVTAALALGSALLATWLAVRPRRVTPLSSATTPEIVSVHAAPGARWSAHTDALSANVKFADGVASFVVHPHQGRRVVVQLPDGEVLDMGTVFEVRVHEQHTQRVAVSEGRVVVRFAGRAEFSLAAGEAWERASAAPVTAPATSSVVVNSATVPRAAVPPARRSGGVAASASSAPPAQAEGPSSASAEDDAYLHIVSLLRTRQAAQARDAAKRYLLRFPNGFRRIEVLNIAMRGDHDQALAAPAE